MNPIRVLISTLWSGKAIWAAITKLSPDKIVFLTTKEPDKTAKRVFEETLDRLKKNFSFIQYDVIKAPTYDMVEIARQAVKVIDEEAKKGNTIAIHITEARKLQSFGLTFAGYARKDKIEGIYYIEEEKVEVHKLPLFDLSIPHPKKAILSSLKKGITDIASLQKISNKSRPVVYSYLKELRENGLIKDNALTEAGELALL